MIAQPASDGVYNEVSNLLNEFHSELEKQTGNPTGLTAVGEKYRDKLLSRQRSTAICAYAIKIAIESRGGCYDGAKWERFRELAKYAKRPSKDHKLEEEQRRMRALAVLWAQWSSKTVTHYKWELHSPKLLTQLGKIAAHFPHWPEFVSNLNYVMLSRHEQSLEGARHRRIGQHHSGSRVQDESSPLEACDVHRLLRHPPSDIELQTFRDRVRHWTRGTHRHLEVHGKRLSEYSNIGHFRLRVDQYGMLVRNLDSIPGNPRNWTISDHGDITCSGVTGYSTRRNNQKKGSVEPAEEAVLEVSESPLPPHDEVDDSGREEEGPRYLSVGESEPKTTIGTASPSRPSTPPQAQSSPSSHSLRSGSHHEETVSTQGRSAFLPQQEPVLPPHEVPERSTLHIPNASSYQGHSTIQPGFTVRSRLESSSRSEYNSLHGSQTNTTQKTETQEDIIPVTSRVFPTYDNATWDRARVPSQPPASAISTSSFSSMIDYSQCTDALKGSRSHVSKTVQNTQVGLILNVNMDRTQEHRHISAHTSAASIDAGTPRGTSLPTPRAMSLSTDSVLPGGITPSYPLSSITNGCVGSLAMTKDIESLEDRTSDVHMADESLVFGNSTSNEITFTNDMRTPARLSNDICSVCNGYCTVAQVPTDIDGDVRNIMFEFAHNSHTLERSAPDEKTRTWIQTMTFVTDIENSRGEREHHLLARNHPNQTVPIFGKSVLTWSPLSNRPLDDIIKTHPGLAHDIQRETGRTSTRKHGRGRDALHRSTHQQVRDEMMRRQRKKRGLRSRLLPKFKGQVQEVQPSSRRIINEEYDGDMQSGIHEETRQAEQQMLSTAEAVDEMYDDSVTDGSKPVGQDMEEGNNRDGTKCDSAKAEDLQQNATITVFPNRGNEMSGRSPMDDPVPVVATGPLIAGGYRSEPIDPKGSWHGKRTAMRDAVDLLSIVDRNALAAIETPVSNAHPDAGPVGMDQTQHIGPPLSPNPGPLICLSKQNGLAAGADLRSNTTVSSVAATGPSAKGGLRDYFPFTKVLAEIGDSVKMLSYDGKDGSISRKRKLPDQPSGSEGLTDPKHAQRQSWEPLRETIDSIRRIWSELDHARIYVTSPGNRRVGNAATSTSPATLELVESRQRRIRTPDDPTAKG